MKKGFWSKSKIVVIGGGNWGTVLANIATQNCAEVHVVLRSEENARAINSTRTNTQYLPEYKLSDKILAVSDVAKAFEKRPQAVIWALPSKVTRQNAKEVAHLFTGEEILIHATKGVEAGSLKRMSVVLREEIPCPRIGVVSGPNLAHEVAKGDPAGTIIASEYEEVIQAGHSIFGTSNFKVFGSQDVVGVEWAGVLKNVLAIAAGCVDAMGMGWNARAMLLTGGLAEMVRFGGVLGADVNTFLGLAGMGDMLATSSSPLSRNYRIGFGLGEGKSLESIIESLGSVAEGVLTAESVWHYANTRDISMPITRGVYQLTQGQITAKDFIRQTLDSY